MEEKIIALTQSVELLKAHLHHLTEMVGFLLETNGLEPMGQRDRHPEKLKHLATLEKLK